MGAAPFPLSAACFDGMPPGRPQLEGKHREKNSIRNYPEMYLLSPELQKNIHAL